MYKRMVERKPTDEVAVLEVEPVQLVAGLFRIRDVFIYHERSALGVCSDALAYLAGILLASTLLCICI